jgi:flavin-dependent dehydrogenase
VTTLHGQIARHYDVLIVGGGPAGSAAGLTLQKRADISVGLIESSAYEHYRIGESLTPGIRPLLEYLQLWPDFCTQQSLQSYGSEAAWGSEQLRSLDFLLTLHGNGWALDRRNFDHMLAHTFQARGGTLLTQTKVLQCQHLATGGWQLQVQYRSGEVQELTCRFLIDASGRRGLLRRQLHLPLRKHDHLVGVGCVAQLPSDAQTALLTRVEACEYGWWYSAPVPGGKISVVLMSDADIISDMQATDPLRWKKLLAEMPLTQARLAGASMIDKPKAFPCFSSCLDEVGGADWVAVGDALAAHDPLSSSGIPHAIGSGVHGAFVVADTLFAHGKLLPAYRQSVQDEYAQYLASHWQHYQHEDRWPHALFWQRRRSVIALEANAVIASRDEERSKACEAVHLSKPQATHLQMLCLPNQALHQIVAQFAQLYPDVAAQNIILELQHCLHMACFTLSDGLSDTFSVEQPTPQAEYA